MDHKHDETSGDALETRDNEGRRGRDENDGREAAGSGVPVAIADGASAKSKSTSFKLVLSMTPAARRLPDDVLASLEAVKAAQRVARERARRETWRARAMVGGIAVVVAFGVFVVRPRVRAGQAVAQPAAKMKTRTTTATAHATAAAAKAPTSAPGGLLAANVAAFPAAPAVAAAGPVSSADLDACQDNYTNKRWHAAAETCAAAFSTHPNDARLALRVAEAQHARAHLAEAGEWARRTLAVDDTQADALAILARAERKAGDPEAAARSFRRYLALAPRGWHAPEAYAALRAERARKRAATAPAASSTTPAHRAPQRAEDATLPPSSPEAEQPEAALTPPPLNGAVSAAE